MTPALTSAVWDSIIPISCFQALELRWANQLIAVVTAEHNLAAHQKVAPVSATEVRSPRVLALYWLWTHTNSWVYKRMEENSCLCHLTTLSYHLCSFCHLQCMGGYRCRCRSLLCSDSWRDHHSQSPEHTHPHLHTHMIKNTHKKGQMGYLLSCQQKQDFLFKVFVKSLSCLCTQTCRRSSSPLAAVGAMHFGVPQQVKASIALIDHGAAGVEVCSLEEAIFQWMRMSTGHTCKTCGNTL